MYALAKISGRQFRLEPGETLKTDRLNVEPGSEYVVADILMYVDGDKYEVGEPYLRYKATLEVIEHARHKKVISQRVTRRGGRRRKIGSRRWYSLVKVKSIEAEGK